MNSENSKGCTVEAPTENHSELYESICEMDFLIERAENLFERITGENQEVATCDRPPNDSPCLTEVLQRGANMIRNKIGQLDESITKIQNALY